MSIDVVETLVDLRRTARAKAKGRYLALLAKVKLSDAELRELSELADEFGRTPDDVRQDIERVREEARLQTEVNALPALEKETTDAQAKADALLTKLNKRRSELDAEEQDATGHVEFLKHRLKTAQSAQRRLADIGREWRQCFGEHTPEPVLKTTPSGGNPYEMQPFAR